ncbi:NADH-quinone oxidoreductase subunit J [Thermochromatium tepidum]|uniref:NADH-quinone oxidoreductase subunit J n=1 Tax=Thermochromatium tepidum ATCC 43061 TaxID=316276 RepID=A0A6I6DXJ3_THETI|nr:NADH-quinone oxidoreductase subunit J [Thermochromatium tepidum]QGU32274.1 NADH-quinone oxidoreductase subunit J [Thermochromatium tepidum ATCC 43061]
MAEKLIFYVLAVITLWAGVMIITRKNPVHSVLFLVLAFVTSAGLWILLEAEFLGIVLVLVYVGAVMVLFLFVVMMLDIDLATLRAGFVRNLPLAGLIAAIMAVEILLIVGSGNFGLDVFPKPEPLRAEVSNTRELGLLIYTVYLYPVEIAAVILLLAIVAAIRLTLRRRPDNKYVDPTQQVRVRKGPDRVRLVRVTPEDGLRILANEKREG